MKNFENFYKSFNEKLLHIKKTSLHDSKKLRDAGRNDEAIFSLVKSNVAGIFLRMTSVCYNLTAGKKKPPIEKLEKMILKHGNGYEGFCFLFNHFLEVIPQTWESQMQLAKVHGEIDKVAKEEAKFSALNSVKEIFNSECEVFIKKRG